MAGLTSAQAHPDFDDLRAFVAVAEAGGFRRASRNGGIRQSVLTRRVRNLEDMLGASLFERHRGGVSLTHAGRQFREDIRPIFAQLETAVSTVRGAGLAISGRLRIGTTASLSSGFLRRLLLHWRAGHPDVTTDVVEAEPRDNIADVTLRRLDVAFISGNVRPSDCDHEQLWHACVMAALPSDHHCAVRASTCISEFPEERFIVSKGGAGTEIRDYVIRFLSDLGVSPRVDFVEASREVLISLVGLGHGVTLVSDAETGVSYPNVTFVPLRRDPLPFNAIWSPENDNPALRRFLSEARLQAKLEKGAAFLRTPDPSP